MSEYHSDVLDQFAEASGVLVIRVGEAKVLEAQKDGVTVKVTVSDQAHEWFVDVIDTDLHDWVDYDGYDDTSREELAAALRTDVGEFVQLLIESELRLRKAGRQYVLEWKTGESWQQALPFYQESKVVRFFSRTYELFVSLLCLSPGGLTSLTSFGMLLNMYLSPESGRANFFWVALVTLLVAPVIFVAGLRLLFNRPTKDGGLFSPLVLTCLAVFYGILGGLIFILALQDGSVRGIISGAVMLIGTQAAFLIARRRKSDNRAVE